MFPAYIFYYIFAVSPNPTATILCLYPWFKHVSLSGADILLSGFPVCAGSGQANRF